MKVRLAAIITICIAALLWYSEPLKSDDLLAQCVSGHDAPSNSIVACTALISTNDPRPEYQFLYYSKRAEAHYRANIYDKALSDANHALSLTPGNSRMLVWRAYAHNALGDRQASDADFEQVLRINKDDTYALYNKAKLHCQRGETGSATRDYERVLAIVPDHQSAMQDLINLLADQSEFERVEQLLNQAALAWPDKEWVYTYRIGYALQYSGDTDVALSTAEKAVELFPESSTALLFLAATNFRMGYDADGIATVEKYLVLGNQKRNLFERLKLTVSSLLLVGQNTDSIARAVFYAGVGKTDLATTEIKSFLANTGENGRKIVLRGFKKEGFLISKDASDGVPEAMDALIADYVAKKQAEVGLSHLVFLDRPGI